VTLDPVSDRLLTPVFSFSCSVVSVAGQWSHAQLVSKSNEEVQVYMNAINQFYSVSFSLNQCTDVRVDVQQTCSQRHRQMAGFNSTKEER